MKAMEQNNLFTEISHEEAAAVSGGGLFEAAAYITVVKALFPDFADSPEVLNTVLLLLTGALSIPEISNTTVANNNAIVTQDAAAQLLNVQT
jgi:hypothetical protein